jgi:hypothetical protein
VSYRPPVPDLSPGALFMEWEIFVPYVWRDPARVDERRAEELRRWDEINAIEDRTGEWQAARNELTRQWRIRRKQQAS